MHSDVMDTAGEIAVLIEFSQKHEELLENLSEQITPNKITKFSTTRWAVRVSALPRIIDNYSYIMEFWNECLVNEYLTTEINLLFWLHLGHCLYSHADNFSKSLQGRKLSAASSKRLANLTISLFQSLRVEEPFESFYNVALQNNERIAIFFRAKVTLKTLHHY